MSCHKTDPDNCTRKHLYPPASNGVINGVFVPSGYTLGVCGDHLYASGSASDHRSVSYACSTHTYYACQTPSTSSHASHSLQASCSSTDSNGNYCTLRNFYACGAHTHRYPTTMTTCSQCYTSYEVGSSAAHSHRSISYPCSTHTYYACQTPSTSSHALVLSCSETSNGNTCTNTSGYYACAPHSHTYPAPPPPAQTWPTCTACNASYNPNSTYHVNLHRPRTCRFSGCGNSWRACSIEGWAPYCNNAYRKSKGWKCGE